PEGRRGRLRRALLFAADLPPPPRSLWRHGRGAGSRAPEGILRCEAVSLRARAPREAHRGFGKRPYGVGARGRVLVRRRAVAHAPDNALHDRGEPEEIIGHVVVEMRAGIEPRALHISRDIVVARRN